MAVDVPAIGRRDIVMHALAGMGRFGHEGHRKTKQNNMPTPPFLQRGFVANLGLETD